MADVQLENGYTRIANSILEALAKMSLNGTQWRILLVIFRYTYGYGRKEHELSLSFISAATGCDKRQIQRELKDLESKGVIIQKVGTKRIVAFNKDYDEWDGKSTNGKSTNEEKANITVGESTNDTIGRTTNQEIKNKNIKKNLISQIENLRKRYSDFLDLIDEYFDILRTTRVSGKIADSVILKVYEQMDKHPISVVKYACLTVITKPDLHSKKENYFFGILRNTDAAEAEKKIPQLEVKVYGTYSEDNKSGYDCSKILYQPKPGESDDNIPEGI